MTKSLRECTNIINRAPTSRPHEYIGVGKIFLYNDIIIKVIDSNCQCIEMRNNFTRTVFCIHILFTWVTLLCCYQHCYGVYFQKEFGM